MEILICRTTLFNLVLVSVSLNLFFSVGIGVCLSVCLFVCHSFSCNCMRKTNIANGFLNVLWHFVFGWLFVHFSCIRAKTIALLTVWNCKWEDTQCFPKAKPTSTFNFVSTNIRLSWYTQPSICSIFVFWIQIKLKLFSKTLCRPQVWFGPLIKQGQQFF